VAYDATTQHTWVASRDAAYRSWLRVFDHDAHDDLEVSEPTAVAPAAAPMVPRPLAALCGHERHVGVAWATAALGPRRQTHLVVASEVAGPVPVAALAAYRMDCDMAEGQCRIHVAASTVVPDVLTGVAVMTVATARGAENVVVATSATQLHAWRCVGAPIATGLPPAAKAPSSDVATACDFAFFAAASSSVLAGALVTGVSMHALDDPLVPVPPPPLAALASGGHTDRVRPVAWVVPRVLVTDPTTMDRLMAAGDSEAGVGPRVVQMPDGTLLRLYVLEMRVVIDEDGRETEYFQFHAC
jgi:hypothetical protein